MWEKERKPSITDKQTKYSKIIFMEKYLIFIVTLGFWFYIYLFFFVFQSSHCLWTIFIHFMECTWDGPDRGQCVQFEYKQINEITAHISMFRILWIIDVVCFSIETTISINTNRIAFDQFPFFLRLLCNIRTCLLPIGFQFHLYVSFFHIFLSFILNTHTAEYVKSLKQRWIIANLSTKWPIDKVINFMWITFKMHRFILFIAILFTSIVTVIYFAALCCAVPVASVMLHLSESICWPMCDFDHIFYLIFDSGKFQFNSIGRDDVFFHACIEKCQLHDEWLIFRFDRIR